MPDIPNGGDVKVRGSSGRTYTLSNRDGVMSCSCPAWRNQSRHPDYRTCKHLEAFRGYSAEARRIEPGDHPLNRPETRQVPTRTPGGASIKHATKTTVRFQLQKNKPEPPPAPSVWDKVKDDDPFGES